MTSEPNKIGLEVVVVGLEVSTDCLNEESTFIEVDLGSDSNELVDALI